MAGDDEAIRQIMDRRKLESRIAHEKEIVARLEGEKKALSDALAELARRVSALEASMARLKSRWNER